MMIRLFLWCFVLALAAHASLIPYGESEGDTYITHSSDNTATVLSVPFVYFENTFTDLYISPNGAISFNEALPPEVGTLKNKNVIAIYYSKTTGGNIYYRVTKNPKVISDMNVKLISAFKEAQNFRATEAVLVTYEDMTAENAEGLNLFQIGMLTNGTESYVTLIYSRLDYSVSAGRYAEMGFYSGNGKVESLFNSGTQNAQEIAKLSMLAEKGVYSYKTTFYPESGKDIFATSNDDYEYTNDDYESQEEPANCPKDSFRDNCPTECNLVPDSRGCKMCVCGRKRSSEVEERPTRTETEGGDSHEPDTLPQQIVPIQSRHQPPASDPGCSSDGSSTETCHADGFCESNCCKCRNEYIGNGKDCVLKNSSIRATGQFEGVISGQSIPAVDFYTFIDTAAGQQHTAINGLPQELAWSLQLLDAIGNGIAWLFAKVESPDVENGFQLTGGVLNRTLNIHLGDKHSIVIKQEFLGRESGALKINIFVRGTLPALDSGATVTFTDFEDKYTREEAGFLRAYADRHIVVRQGEQEVQHRVTVDQQIRYKECPYKQSRNKVVIVRVSRVSSAFEHGKTLRFGSQGAVYNEEDARKIAEQNSNPCINSYHVCNQPNMFCKPEGGQYRCECEAGYQYFQDDTVEPKFRCVDANECSRKPCHRNAECVNTVGSFLCRCLPGYIGDGKECRRDESEGASATSGCRSHSECHQWGECVFSNGSSSGFCKCRGWYVGDGVTNCGPPQVSYNVEPNQYNEGSRHQHPVSVESCEKRLNCHFHAQCVATGRPDPPALCQCRHGYEGNGTHCTNKDELALRLPTDSKECNDQSDCHQFAHCTLREDQNKYYCSCLPGYRGDGHTNCVKSEECDYLNPSNCDSNAQCRFSSEAQIYRCECNSGYVKQGTACVVGNQPQPQETCNVNPYVCHSDANCVHDESQNRHHCVCKPGKEGDGYLNCRDVQQITGYGYTSAGEDPKQTLLIGRGMSIIQRSPGANVPGRQFIVVPYQVVVDISYDCITDKIFWSDIAGHSIRQEINNCKCLKSATSNGTDKQVVFSERLRSPEGIAIDYASRNIYYADSIKDEIGVISLDGKYQKALLTEGLVNPRALTIDLDGRKLYYSDWHRRNPRIGRIDLDGKNNQDFVKDDIGLPNGLALLPNRRELCWVDAGKKQLNCIRTDGTARRTVYAPLDYPFGLTHENEERFYWTDWKDFKVHSVSVFGSGYQSFVPSVASQGKVYGILSLNHKCQGRQTECSNNKGGCQHICVPGQNGATCLCPDNIPDIQC